MQVSGAESRSTQHRNASLPPPNNMFPFLPALSANLRNMLFPCLKSAELQFSRIYHLMAKFWPTITLCSLCQSTYMSCNQRAFFPILPPTLPWGGRNCDGLHSLSPAVPGMTHASSQKVVAQILSQRKHQACSTQPMAPPKPKGILSPAPCGRIRATKYRPCKASNTLNKFVFFR